MNCSESCQEIIESIALEPLYLKRGRLRFTVGWGRVYEIIGVMPILLARPPLEILGLNFWFTVATVAKYQGTSTNSPANFSASSRVAILPSTRANWISINN